MKLHCLPILNIGMSGVKYVFSSEYQAVYDSFTTKPSDAIAKQQDVMIRALVSTGLWSKFDIFYLLAQTVNSDGEALKNWKNPGTYDATAMNGPTFTALEGFKPNGTTQYIDSNYSPSTQGVQYAQDSASIGIYIRDNIDEAGAVDMSVSDAASGKWTYIRTRALTGRINQPSAGVAGAVADCRGMNILTRTGANASAAYLNKVEAANDNVTASNGIPDNNVELFRRATGGYSTKQASCAFAGSGLTVQNISDIVDAIEAYMDSNGKGVIT